MKNPLRDEGAAFQLVLLTLGAFALIALGSWINTWLGLGVFLALAGVAGHAIRGGLKERERMRVTPAGDGIRRVLVVANETVGGEELLSVVRARTGAGGRVHVVAPALNTRLRTWVSDEDGARAAAADRLSSSLSWLRGVGIVADGQIGDADPVQAIEDALRTFAADEIVLSTHPEGRSSWLERGVTHRVQERFELPLTHVVVDLDRRPMSDTVAVPAT
ncbi:MAG: hypothetical protein FJW96_02035 [Actinobacteria bacterium]|nr:hypothetical protein [Actinomycetota bacterium]